MELGYSSRKRKAVAGILAAIIFFAMFFTAGVAVILYTFTSYNHYDQAQVNAIQQQQAKSAEQLTVRTCDSGNYTLPRVPPFSIPASNLPCTPLSGSLPSGAVGVWVENSGSAAITLQGLWVQNSTSATLQVTPTQGVFATPITIGPGSSIVVAAGFTPAHNSTYVVTFLTSLGNQFSAVYPPPPLNLNVIGPPTITTTLFPGSTVPTGQLVYDTATISGIKNLTGYYVEYDYYGNPGSSPSGQPDGTCAGTGTWSAVPLTSSTAPPSSQISYPYQGPYSWQASLWQGYPYNIGSTRIVTSSCEPLTVGQSTIGLTTTLSPSQVTSLPADVTDTAVVTGMTDAGGYVAKFNYFNNSACGTGAAYTPPSPTMYDAVTFQSGSVSATSSTVHLTQGSYSFNAQLYDSAGNPITTSPCEPLSISKGPITVSTFLSPPVLAEFPQNAFDTASVSGISNAAGYTIQYSSYGNVPTGTSDANCNAGDAHPAGTVTISAGTVAPPSNLVSYTVGGTYSWNAVLLDPNGNQIAVSPCEQLVTLSTVSSAFGLGFISMDFNSYKAEYTTGNCYPGNAGCTLMSEPGGFVRGAQLAYTVPTTFSTGDWLVFSVNVTNTDPSGRNIVLDQFSVLNFLQVPAAGKGGGTAGAFPWFLGSVSSSGAISTTFPAGGIVIPTQSIAPQGVTIFFAVQGGSQTQTKSYPAPGIWGVFMYLHGTMGKGCTTLSTCPTPIGMNEPLVSTVFTTGASVAGPAVQFQGSTNTVSPGGHMMALMLVMAPVLSALKIVTEDSSKDRDAECLRTRGS